MLLRRINVSVTGGDELTKSPCKIPVEKMFRGLADPLELLAGRIVPRNVRTRRRLMIVNVFGAYERCRTFNSNRKSYSWTGARGNIMVSWYPRAIIVYLEISI